MDTVGFEPTTSCKQNLMQSMRATPVPRAHSQQLDLIVSRKVLLTFYSYISRLVLAEDPPAFALTRSIDSSECADTLPLLLLSQRPVSVTSSMLLFSENVNYLFTSTCTPWTFTHNATAEAIQSILVTTTSVTLKDHVIAWLCNLVSLGYFRTQYYKSTIMMYKVFIAVFFILFLPVVDCRILTEISYTLTPSTKCPAPPSPTTF